MAVLAWALPLLLFTALVAHGAATSGSGNNNNKIQHVVVLMLENRAFDHMCGRLGKWIPGLDGLTGKEYNIANGTKYYVQPTAPYISPIDPDHSVTGTTKEIMGDTLQWIDPEPMSGFAQHHFDLGAHEFWQVMHGFPPEKVPAISTLAKEFAVFDRYYASLPGPTYPNRMFFLSGTTHGMTDNDILDYLPGMPQRTIMAAMDDANVTWRNYFTDLPDMILFKDMRTWKNLLNMRFFEDFAKDAAAGDLPQFTWLNPRFVPFGKTPASDQHPDHDVVAGEEVIAEVYAALRSSPLWNSTALIVTYDEHGGFYDHVSPPMDGVPSPDGINGQDGFNFTRMGLRICHVVASPWIPKGTLVHEPEGSPNTRFEHTSTFQTLRNLFGIEEQLTNRSMWAAPYDFIFSLDSPRTDAPMTLPTPPKHSPEALEALVQEQLLKPINGLQRELYAVAQAAAGLPVTGGSELKNQEELGIALRHVIKKAVVEPQQKALAELAKKEGGF